MSVDYFAFRHQTICQLNASIRGGSILIHLLSIAGLSLFGAASLAQDTPPATPEGSKGDTQIARPLVCSGTNGTVIIDTSGQSPVINIPSTLWPKKGDGWYQMVNLSDEPTVVKGKIDLGNSKASFSLDKYTLRLTIEKSEGFVPLGRPLYLIANCTRP